MSGTVPNKPLRKHPSKFEPGEEFIPFELEVTPELANYCMMGTNNRNPWFMGESPFGGAVAPPIMIQALSARVRALYLWGDFVGPVFVEPPGIHCAFDATYINPVKVGEKITVKGKCKDNYEKRGRRYIEIETTVYGQDGRLCTRYVGTHSFLSEAKPEGKAEAKKEGE